MRISLRPFVLATVLLLAFVSNNFAANGPDVPLAQVSVTPSMVQWRLLTPAESVTLTVSGPDGDTFTAESKSSILTFSVKDLGASPDDGTYVYQLVVVPPIPASVKDQLKKARKNDDEKGAKKVAKDSGLLRSLTQSGSISILNGSFVPADRTEETSARLDQTNSAVTGAVGGVSADAVLRPKPHDQVIPDDLIVQGSACVGLDCVNNESFGFDTIRMKENNTRIKFEDTSVGSFPTNDWTLSANESASGGASRFAIENVDGARFPFTVMAGAPANSIFAGSTGRIGLRTATPVLDLHIVTSDTPSHRLEQNSAGGFTAQTWDIAGNEANFFVRDVTGGSRLPFRIRPGAPTSSIDISASGNVGIGTASPAGKLHVATTTGGPFIVTTDGKVAVGTAIPTDPFQVVVAGGANLGDVKMRMVGTGATTWAGFHLTDNVTADGFVGFRSGATPLLGFANNSASPQMVLTAAGFLGLGITNPTNPIQHSNGALLTPGGAWTNGSSREYKQDITELRVTEAFDTLRGLDPIKFSYKVAPDEHHVGFIAEDVPELVAMKDRKSLSSMDIVAVLTKVVQEQQKTIAELKARVEHLEQK